MIVNASSTNTSFFIAIFLQERGVVAGLPNERPGPGGVPFLLDFERPDCFQKNVSDSGRESFRPAA